MGSALRKHEENGGVPSERRVVVVGIGGASRSGKSVLAAALSRAVQTDTGLVCRTVGQDGFFDTDWIGRHGQDWEAEQAVDHAAFLAAVAAAECTADVVVIEGFQCFHDPLVVQRLDIALWLDCSKETVCRRRMATKRVSSRYFEEKLWPAHLRHRRRAFANLAARPPAGGVHRLDGDSGATPAEVARAAMAHLRPNVLPPAWDRFAQRSCSRQAIARAAARAAAAAEGSRLAVVVLPGSLNPVHREHIRCLWRAREHLEAQHAATVVVGGFLQPSADSYVRRKLGAQAISLQTRAKICDLAAASDPRSAAKRGARWIDTWCSADVNGSSAAASCAALLSRELRRPVTPYVVCGADFVRRCGGWHWKRAGRGLPDMVVVPRPGEKLPATAPAHGSGWHLARAPGDAAARGSHESCGASSTRLRALIAAGEWSGLVDNGLTTATVASFLRGRHDAGELYMGLMGQRRAAPAPPRPPSLAVEKKEVEKHQGGDGESAVTCRHATVTAPLPVK